MRKNGAVKASLLAIAFVLILSGCTWNDDDNNVTTKSRTDGNVKPFGANRMGVTPPSLLPSIRPDNNGITHNNKRLTQSQKTAQRLTKMNEISSATVLLSENNAYVGVKLNVPRYGGQSYMGTPNRNLNGMDAVNDQLRAKITKRVKQMNPSINSVYISASPDMNKRFEGYSNQLNRGDSADGFISQFNENMRDMFPLDLNNNNK